MQHHVRELADEHTYAIDVGKTILAMRNNKAMRAEIAMKVDMSSACLIEDVNLLPMARISQVPLVAVIHTNCCNQRDICRNVT